MLRAVIASLLASVANTRDTGAQEVQICPGEGPRYGDYKCNHDGTHRVCAQLIEDKDTDPCQPPRKWGNQTFWQITGQEAHQWDHMIKGEPNPGDSWCICMWAFAAMVETVGCDNVHFRCEATDVAFVLTHPNDRYGMGRDLTSAHECIRAKCPTQAFSVASERMQVIGVDNAGHAIG